MELRDERSFNVLPLVLNVQALCDCPEDATIERDLVSCTDVARYMSHAYEAGKDGEEFSVEIIKDAPQT